MRREDFGSFCDIVVWQEDEPLYNFIRENPHQVDKNAIFIRYSLMTLAGGGREGNTINYVKDLVHAWLEGALIWED